MKIYEVTNGIQGQIKKSNANEVEIEDPKKPGVVTKIDLKTKIHLVDKCMK